MIHSKRINLVRRELLMIGILLMAFGLLTQIPQTLAKSIKPDSKVIGDLRIIPFDSRIFENSRNLRVLLPDGYSNFENRERSYPVLYLNDGQDLFDASTSVFNPIEWKVDESVQRLTESGIIEPLIVVGIDNAGKKRRPYEYLPFPDVFLEPPVPDPLGILYPRFLTEEVIPFIESRYRIKKGSDSRVLGGSSYGALISLYCTIKNPDFWGGLLLESGSFYVAEARILELSKQMTRWPEKIYLGVGTNESGQPDCGESEINLEAVTDVQKLAEIFRTGGLGEDRLLVRIDPCAVHDENAWASRFPSALKFLYGK